MVEFTHVLCPIDLGAASERPLAYAAAIARWYESSLTVQHIVPTFDAVPIMSGDFITPAQVIPPVSREDVLAEMRRLAEPITGTCHVTRKPSPGCRRASRSVHDPRVSGRGAASDQTRPPGVVSAIVNHKFGAVVISAGASHLHSTAHTNEEKP